MDILSKETGIENKRFHMQIIQGAIERMASNSFIIKGWSLTAFGGLFTLFIANQDKLWSYDLLWLTLICALVFWWHDAYYLKIERQFRKLYSEVISTEPENICFSMTPPPTDESLLFVAFRPILIGSYGIIVIASMVLLYLLK
ncbi:hypothetical protein [Enterococcus avium]|nr:hypothetical protein [Enterococcus avium]